MRVAIIFVTLLGFVGSQQAQDALIVSTNIVSTNREAAARGGRPRVLREAKTHVKTRLESDRRGLNDPQVKHSYLEKRLLLESSLDVKSDGFSPYYAALITIVKDRWFHLIGSRDFSTTHTGQVVLQFNLHQDGRVTALKVLKSTVGESLSLLCEKAVLDPPPFPRWPAEMRKQTAADSRIMTLTFNYLPDEAQRKK